MERSRRARRSEERREEDKSLVSSSRPPSLLRVLRALSLIALSTSLVFADDATTQPSLDTTTILSILKFENKIDHDVLTFTVPRDDLQVTIDGMAVPTAAGIASHVWFYQCPCGRARMTGELVVCDYEADDVVAALHGDNGSYADVRVDAVSPMFSMEKPAMRIVRLHGEGTPDGLARRIADAFENMGAARMRKSTTMPATHSVKE